jgi:hypothetical protein
MRGCILLIVLILPAFSADWTPLFDGRSTAGWMEITGKPFPNTCWKIEDGCLKSFPNPTGMQDIRTVAVYHDFEFEWEWKMLARGNSGVKYLIQKVDEWTPKDRGRQARARGLEYQMADDANDEASDPTRACGSLYSVFAPSPRVKPAIGEFNRSRIVVRGSRVEHWLNGVRVVAFQTGSPELLGVLGKLRGAKAEAFPDGSPISLQNHASETWFRNIRIRRTE